jgi:hypothetical protein
VCGVDPGVRGVCADDEVPGGAPQVQQQPLHGDFEDADAGGAPDAVVTSECNVGCGGRKRNLALWVTFREACRRVGSKFYVLGSFREARVPVLATLFFL